MVLAELLARAARSNQIVRYRSLLSAFVKDCCKVAAMMMTLGMRVMEFGVHCQEITKSSKGVP